MTIIQQSKRGVSGAPGTQHEVLSLVKYEPQEHRLEQEPHDF